MSLIESHSKEELLRVLKAMVKKVSCRVEMTAGISPEYYCGEPSWAAGFLFSQALTVCLGRWAGIQDRYGLVSIHSEVQSAMDEVETVIQQFISECVIGDPCSVRNFFYGSLSLVLMGKVEKYGAGIWSFDTSDLRELVDWA